jgi:hypothetical protein
VKLPFNVVPHEVSVLQAYTCCFHVYRGKTTMGKSRCTSCVFILIHYVTTHISSVHTPEKIPPYDKGLSTPLQQVLSCICTESIWGKMQLRTSYTGVLSPLSYGGDRSYTCVECTPAVGASNSTMCMRYIRSECHVSFSKNMTVCRDTTVLFFSH